MLAPRPSLLLLGGLGFKLSLVPFHVWTPQAYAGRHLPVAVFLAAMSKVAALAALLVVVQAVTSAGRAPVLVGVGVLAAVSMTLGNLMALRAGRPVRLLAWSTVAQAGWVVLPLLRSTSLGGRASAGYLLAYVVATLVAFTVVHVVTARRVAAASPTGTHARGIHRPVADPPAGSAGRCGWPCCPSPGCRRG